MTDTARSGALDLTVAPPRSAGAAGRRRLRLTIYCAVSALAVLTLGLPVERVVTLVWLFGLLVVAVTADSTERLRPLVRDWGLFAVLLLAYRYSAGLADGVGRPVLMAGLVDADRIVGFGEVPTVRLQQIFDQTGTAPLWQVPLSFVYVSHFFAVLVAAALLWLRDRPAWVAYTKRLLSLGVLAVVTYVVVPAAPPWMAADEGLIDPIVRSSFLGWERVGLGIVEPVIEQGRAVANPVAALPSMHAGFAAFLAAFFWPRTGTAGRMLWALYAVSMGFTLVLTGEHWVVDVFAGWLYVAVVMGGWALVDRRRRPEASTDEDWRSPVIVAE
jgi:membrane-associated phospholipid phosphatase